VGYNGWFSSTAGILSRETDTIGTDPLFQDLPGKDFRLQPGSLAIDAGMDIGYPYQQKAPDLGADEYRP
jgi:hypothetical protein